MDTTTTTTNRTGAVWVAGTGAFLLLAATALFVAVRWDDIPGAAKLGIVGALTGAFLLGGCVGVSPVPGPPLLEPAAVAAMAAATIARRPAAASPGEAAAGFGSGGREVETPAAREGAGAPGGREQRGNGVVAARLALMWATLAGLAPVIGAVAVARLHSGGRAGGAVPPGPVL